MGSETSKPKSSINPLQEYTPLEDHILRKSLLGLRNRHFAILDVILLSFSPVIALTLRLNPPWPSPYFQAILVYTLLALLIKLVVFYSFKLYTRYWRYASIDELITITFSVITSTILITGIYWIFLALGWAGELGLPRSVPFIDGLLTLIFVGGCRFSVRAIEYVQARDPRQRKGKRALVVGAGDAGEIMVREMLNSRLISLEPVGFVDDDPHKIGTIIHGVVVLGSIEEIPDLVSEYKIEEVIIAIPTATGEFIRRVVALCQKAGVPSRTMPGIFELLSGRVGVNRLRKVEIEDLLRRTPVRVDTVDVSRMLTGKRILITGAGGSIGSELCRQILRFEPSRLVLVGHGENSLFSLEQELGKLREDMVISSAIDLQVILADVRDLVRLKSIFSHFSPQIVFHAAAHKHVTLMESNIEEAVTNNILGTLNAVRASQEHGVERFVLISTDKAVNPVNTMGMTKRVAELIVHRAAEVTGNPYVSVRFGNVLGSRGSVVLIFQEQIARGGPVTITHPEVTRYFMTIPEAVQLVLQAAAMGRGGEVYVLDMGQPVRIVDLVKDMIELSGFQPDVDIPIMYTGLRPGEKLHEELFSSLEKPERTKHEKIYCADNGTNVRSGSFKQDLEELILLAQTGVSLNIRDKLCEIACEAYVLRE